MDPAADMLAKENWWTFFTFVYAQFKSCLPLSTYSLHCFCPHVVYIIHLCPHVKCRFTENWCLQVPFITFASKLGISYICNIAFFRTRSLGPICQFLFASASMTGLVWLFFICNSYTFLDRGPPSLVCQFHFCKCIDSGTRLIWTRWCFWFASLEFFGTGDCQVPFASYRLQAIGGGIPPVGTRQYFLFANLILFGTRNRWVQFISSNLQANGR